jgi:hypothetical protein
MNKKEKLGQESAFPSWDMTFEKNPETDLFSAGTEKGMSKRLYIAIEVMKKLDLPKWSININEYKNYKVQWAKDCFRLADELLKQENE